MAIGLAFSAMSVALCEARRRGRGVEVYRTASLPLPAGALVPSLGSANVVEAAACDAVLGAILGDARRPGGLAAVAIPDLAVRVRFLDSAPAGGTREERARLVAWQLRESLPFAPAVARLDYAALGGSRTLALVASSAIVAGYEDLARRRGLLPLQVAPASLTCFTLLEPEVGPEPVAMVFAEADHVTLLLVADERPCAWRCLPDRGQGVEAIAAELADTLHALEEDGTVAGPVAIRICPDGSALAPALAAETGRPVDPIVWPGWLPEPTALPRQRGMLAALGAVLTVEASLGWR